MIICFTKRTLMGLFISGLFACHPATSANNVTALAKSEALKASGFQLSSPLIASQGALSDSLKCQRDGGTGQSPPLQWNDPPVGTQSYAVVMHHYPNGTTPGKDHPSHYWLLWNLPGDLRALEQGNPQSLGTEGSDKDGRTTGYTPPCSPGGSGTHEYVITLYALSAPPSALGVEDRLDVTWETLTHAISETTLASSQFMFTN